MRTCPVFVLGYFTVRVTGVTDILRCSSRHVEHAATCTHSQVFYILTHSSSLSLFTLLTPITPLCWQRAFPVQATEKALLLPPKCWHAQRHPSPPHSFFTPSVSCCLYCSLALSLCHSAALSVIKMNFELVFCVFRSLVVLCKVAVSFNHGHPSSKGKWEKAPQSPQFLLGTLVITVHGCWQKLQNIGNQLIFHWLLAS